MWSWKSSTTLRARAIEPFRVKGLLFFRIELAMETKVGFEIFSD